MSYITLLSDFGLQDASVAIAKGAMLQHAPDCNIIDITHEVQPFNIKQAAYLLGAAYKHFPKGTCHVPLFDIFSDGTPRLILSEYKGHYFLAPDNGLLSLALNDKDIRSWLGLELQRSQSFNDWLKEAGTLINNLQAGQPDELGLTPYDARQIASDHPLDANTIDCEIVHIDQFDNIVVNFTKQQYEQLGPIKEFRLAFIKTEAITEISTNYSDVREGYRLCRFNGNDHLEIAINHGRAASLFGMRLGGKHNNIKIIYT